MLAANDVFLGGQRQTFQREAPEAIVPPPAPALEVLQAQRQCPDEGPEVGYFVAMYSAASERLLALRILRVLRRADFIAASKY